MLMDENFRDSKLYYMFNLLKVGQCTRWIHEPIELLKTVLSSFNFWRDLPFPVLILILIRLNLDQVERLFLT
jgi:hypothetical protein